MSYEVIKRVGGRAYRYNVQSYRDKDTGKVRGKWTYLGHVVDDAACPIKPKRDTRGMLIAAFLELHKTTPLSKMHAAMVAEAAGCAYATFYRYFKSMDQLIEAALTRCEHCAGEGFVTASIEGS
jgi:hypothetical protein